MKKLFSPFVNFILPDTLFIKLKFYRSFKRQLCLKNPRSFNEKLQWLKLYDRNPDYTKMVDKYEVRDYIKEKIGEEYLIPLLGVWENFDDIYFSKLPDQFVLKTTHDSGGVWICKDKNNIDLNKLKKEITKHLKRNYYWGCREWPYKNVKPRIIAEKFMVDESGTELKDYKFMCFNSEVKLVQVMSNRVNGKYNLNHFDKNWNKLNIKRLNLSENLVEPSKPKRLDDMIQIAETLSKDITFARIDLYLVKRKIYFGEITFYPVSGWMKFEDDSFDLLLGSWLSLPDKGRF